MPHTGNPSEPDLEIHGGQHGPHRIIQNILSAAWAWWSSSFPQDDEARNYKLVFTAVIPGDDPVLVAVLHPGLPFGIWRW